MAASIDPLTRKKESFALSRTVCPFPSIVSVLGLHTRIEIDSRAQEHDKEIDESGLFVLGGVHDSFLRASRTRFQRTAVRHM